MVSSSDKSAPASTTWHNISSLGKFWYVVLMVGLYIWLIYYLLADYIGFKNRARDPRYGNEWSEIPLAICVLVFVAVFAMAPLHIYSAALPMRHIVNDGLSLAQDDGEMLKEHVRQLYEYSSWRLIGSRLIAHLRPCAYTLHVMVAAAMMIPGPILLSETIRNEAVAKMYLGQSELVYLLTGQFSPPDVTSRVTTSFEYTEWGSQLSIFSVNYAVAALLFLTHYPAFFWPTAPAFSQIYSFFSFLSFAQILVEFYTFSLLHKLTVNDVLSLKFLGSSWTCLGLWLLSVVFTWLTHVVVFEYGFLHALLCLSRHRQYFLSDKSSKVFVEETLVKTTNQWLSKYWSIGAGVTLFVLQLIIKVPILMEYTNAALFLKTSLVFPACVGFTTLFLLATLAMWFIFCVKRSWSFHLSGVNLQHSNSPPPPPRNRSLHSLLNEEKEKEGNLPQSTTEEAIYHFYPDAVDVSSGHQGTMNRFGVQQEEVPCLSLALPPSQPESDDDQQVRMRTLNGRKSSLNVLGGAAFTGAVEEQQNNASIVGSMIPGMASFPGSPRPPIPGSTGMECMPHSVVANKILMGPSPVPSTAPYLPPKMGRSASIQANPHQRLYFKSTSVSGSGHELDHQDSPNLSTTLRLTNCPSEAALFDNVHGVPPPTYQMFPGASRQTTHNSEYIELSTCHMSSPRIPYSMAASATTADYPGIMPDSLQVSHEPSYANHRYTNWSGSSPPLHHGILYDSSSTNKPSTVTNMAAFLDRQGLSSMGIAEEDFPHTATAVTQGGLQATDANASNLCSEV